MLKVYVSNTSRVIQQEYYIFGTSCEYKNTSNDKIEPEREREREREKEKEKDQIDGKTSKQFNKDINMIYNSKLYNAFLWPKLRIGEMRRDLFQVAHAYALCLLYWAAHIDLPVLSLYYARSSSICIFRSCGDHSDGTISFVLPQLSSNSTYGFPDRRERDLLKLRFLRVLFWDTCIYSLKSMRKSK